MNARPERIVVVGSDAPLWLAASVLRAGLAPSGVVVEAVELPARAGTADVHATQPALEALHNQLRIDEAALLRATRGSFSLGQRFGGGDAPFFHAFGSYGAPIDGGNFLPFWLKARRFGLNATLADFSLTAAAARQGKMLLPDEDTDRFGRADYGYHLPAAAYARSLKALAAKDGIVIHEAVEAEAVLGAGGIEAITLGGDRRVTGGFFIDMTAGGSLMTALGVGIESWEASFPANRVLHARGPGFRSVPCFAEIRAAGWGWAGLYPAQTETYIVAAWSSVDLDDEAAVATAAATSGLPLAEVRFARSHPGRREQAWAGNCVALGDAACGFDPVHDVALHAVQLGLVHLLSLFPVGGEWAPERAEYNRLMRALFERTRDFQAAHYLLNRYPGRFWRHAREADPPPALAHKLATFAARGELSLLEDETFPLDSWNALLIGHGLIPDSHAPSADRTPPETMKAEFRRMLGFIKDKVLEQPSHDAYLAEHCGRRAA